MWAKLQNSSAKPRSSFLFFLNFSPHCIFVAGGVPTHVIARVGQFWRHGWEMHFTILLSAKSVLSGGGRITIRVWSSGLVGAFGIWLAPLPNPRFLALVLEKPSSWYPQFSSAVISPIAKICVLRCVYLRPGCIANLISHQRPHQKLVAIILPPNYFWDNLF